MNVMQISVVLNDKCCTLSPKTTQIKMATCQNCALAHKHGADIGTLCQSLVLVAL